MSDFSVSLFQSTAVAYALGIVIVAFVLLFIPSLLVPGAKPQGIARAISCYMWKTVGLFVMAMSIVQLAYNLVTGRLPDPQTLSALILLFVVGVGTMVQASRMVKSVDEASSVVVRLVFSHTCEIAGGIIALISCLSIALTVLITGGLTDWEFSATMLLLGVTTMLAASIHIKHKNGGTKKPSLLKRRK